jgi:membrane-associated phospholipid phosphatase
MHVIGAWGHARGTGSRDKLAIGATGHVRNTGRRNRAAIGVSGHAGVGGWRRVAGRVRWGRVARELVLVAVFLAGYEEIRWHMVQAGGAAASHALSVVSAERALGLFHERAVQAVLTPWDRVTDALNTYYGGTHFLVPAAILAWLLLRHPERYARARTALAVTTAAAFVCFWLYPVAPPRLLPASFGFVDTLRDGASGHLEGSLINTAGDQYASMPSLHVAWAVWCALVLYPMFRHWALRALVVAYPVMTTLVVVATGNHYFLDAVAGTLLACLVWAVVSRTARTGGEPGPRPSDQDGDADDPELVLYPAFADTHHHQLQVRR